MKNVVIALEANKFDNPILSYLKTMHSIYSFDRMCFVHVVPDHLVSMVNTPALKESTLEDKVKKTIEEKLKDGIGKDQDVKVDIVVLFGSPYRRIIEFVDQEQPDLLVLGKKKGGSGITPRRIAHHVKSNILFVADSHPATISSIQVPTDYSSHTVRALREALLIGERLGDTKITSLHVIRMLPTDYYYGLDANQHYLEVLKENAQDAYGTMLREADIPENALSVAFLKDHRSNIARSLFDHIKETKPDLIILGAIGHSKINNLLFGSTAERLVSLCVSTNILLVRQIEE